MTANPEATLTVWRNGFNIGYIATLDDSESITPIERHARRFTSQGLVEYERMAKAKKTKFVMQDGDEFHAQTAQLLF